MEILKVSESVDKAVDILKNDGLIVYPTDTLYALGANALSETAVRKVFEVKGRDFNKPISIAVKDLQQAKKYFIFNKQAESIAKKFLPGPLTIILKSNNLPKILSPSSKFSFRIPDNKIALDILDRLDFPLTATSANISGDKDPVDAKIATRQIGNKVDIVLDCGRCKYSKPSTVVDLSDGINVIREGVISKEELYKNL
jgi:L-threonylcarbamoyladenylate synthase